MVYAEGIGKKLRTESSDSVAILLGAAGWPIGSALLLVAHDAWVVLATLAAGVREAARRRRTATSIEVVADFMAVAGMVATTGGKCCWLGDEKDTNRRWMDRLTLSAFWVCIAYESYLP